ncbi:PRA1 family protein B3-like [Dioscorea cayenensis subsp. rotundata]|uniref:PRA1 family protein n=1 Tax=Dioscorea cayennensis subsp. rotundata TaxID=55577 RepID=A0AB40D0S3_DIOCR|nr:PRA1 family protein B3-like [Dioscorea cayenensis subsp. rotundata]XP_039145796.1 PRA1 family protein B3-like [Dioscorea cayenensis subsp. rotundata]
MASTPAPASVPAVIPITTNPSPTPATTPAVRQFITGVTDSVRRVLAQGRPWSEVLDRSAFSRPESLSDATSRLRKNLPYFRANYSALLAAALGLSLLSNPGALLVLLFLLASWCFLYLFRPSDQPLVLLGRTFSDRETLGGLTLLTIIVVFLTSVGSTIISALMVGAAIICAHGAFRMPEDLFLDDPESGSATTGFLSFLGGSPSPAAAVAVRV